MSDFLTNYRHKVEMKCLYGLELIRFRPLIISKKLDCFLTCYQKLYDQKTIQSLFKHETQRLKQSKGHI